MIEPFVSICIPTYNGQEYLVQCINSCINQSYKNYELIICDDGSTDNTVEILELYASKHSTITLIKNEKNLGLVGNWNKCIDVANGTWIKFVFQDDYITNTCLQEFVNSISENTRLLVCKRHFILPDNPTDDYVNYYTNVVKTLENTNNNRSHYFSSKLISSIAIKFMCMNFIGEPTLMMFKKELINECGYFNNELKQICDLEFAMRIASKYGLTYIPQQLCAFRIHDNSTTAKNVALNTFTLSHIEPLLYSYFLLFTKQFQSFRENLTFFQLFKLKLYFQLKAYKAYKINTSMNYQHELFNDKLLNFKEIDKVKSGNFYVKLLSKFI